MTTLIFPATINLIPEVPSISFFGYSDNIRERWEKNLALEELRKDIGNDLFEELSEEDKQFMLETEGSIDLGHKAGSKDLKRIFASIKNEYNY